MYLCAFFLSDDKSLAQSPLSESKGLQNLFFLLDVSQIYCSWFMLPNFKTEYFADICSGLSTTARLFGVPEHPQPPSSDSLCDSSRVAALPQFCLQLRLLQWSGCQSGGRVEASTPAALTGTLTVWNQRRRQTQPFEHEKWRKINLITQPASKSGVVNFYWELWKHKHVQLGELDYDTPQ